MNIKHWHQALIGKLLNISGRGMVFLCASTALSLTACSTIQNSPYPKSIYPGELPVSGSNCQGSGIGGCQGTDPIGHFGQPGMDPRVMMDPHFMPQPPQLTTGAIQEDCKDCQRAWPPDEYIFDGGDVGESVGVTADWETPGLNLTDTVAHFESLDGETSVEASNRVCIYAPRFASVRSVKNLYNGEQIVTVNLADMPEGTGTLSENQPAVTRLNRIQATRNIGRVKIQAFDSEKWAAVSAQTAAAFQFQDQLVLPYENTSLIKYGIVTNEDKLFISQTAQAAIEWTHDLGVQVLMNDEEAYVVDNVEKVQDVYQVKGQFPAELRICKVASKKHALPGEIVEFTLRFDNTGQHVLGNLVIVDNLTTRLEYIPDSVEVSCLTGYPELDENGNEKKDADGNTVWERNPVAFSTLPNEGDSLKLRWMFDAPIQAGKGGVIRFKCRVR